MPILKKRPNFQKKILIILATLILGLVIYLNRSYSHIFDYDKTRITLNTNIQRKYILENRDGEGTINYVALGDSLTYGLGAFTYQETFPFVLAGRSFSNYKKVEVNNLAVSGAVIDDVLTMQLPEALNEKPGFITLMIGTNDVHNFARKEEFKNSLIYIIGSLKKNTGAKILLINIPFLGTKTLILPPHDKIIDARIRDFNRSIKEAAETEGVKYFDLYNASMKHFLKEPEKYYSPDGFHPSGKGYILWGNLINAD